MTDEPKTHEPKTDEELKTIAKDLWAGKIFTDRHCKRERDLELVFMLLPLASREELEKLAKIVGEHGMLYEYIDQAMPTSVNGMPCFLSLKLLSSEEFERMSKFYDKIKEAMEGI